MLMQFEHERLSLISQGLIYGRQGHAMRFYLHHPVHVCQQTIL